MHVAKNISLSLLVMACVLVAIMRPSHSADKTVDLVIGVRTDAAPFSYKRRSSSGGVLSRSSDGVLKRLGYDGYVVHICDRVLTELELQYRDRINFKVEVVNAEDRFSSLRSNRIDILCDPATITRNRVREFIASTPVYLSGITFASQPIGVFNEWGCRSIVGFVGKTTSQTMGVRRILEHGEWPRHSKEIRRYIDNQDTSTLKRPGCNGDSEKLGPTILAFKTHDELAAAFCDKKILYYVGDIEIVTRKIREIKDCKSRDASQTYTDERYAIFIKASDSDTGKAFFLLKFLEVLSMEIFNRDPLLLESFSETFPGYQASQKLETFYWSLFGRYPNDKGGKN